MVAIYPDLAGQVVLVTGGASGIGEAIVRRFAEQRAKVTFLDVKKAEGEKLAAELSAHFAAVDLTDTRAMQAAIGEIGRVLGPVRILINNAAHDERHTTESVTPEYWDERIAVNLKHQFFAAQAVLPDMKARGRGSTWRTCSISAPPIQRTASACRKRNSR